MRAATGACALSIGLLVCSSGGAIATADQTGTDGSPTDTQAGNGEGTNTPSLNGPTSVFGSQRVDEDPDEGFSTTTTITTIATGTGTSLTNGHGPTSTVNAQTNTSEGEQQEVTNTVETAVVQTEAPSSLANTPVLDAITHVLETDTPLTESSTAPDPTTAPAAAQGNGTSGSSPATTGAPVPPAPGSLAPKPPSIGTAVFEPVSNAINTLARALGAAGLTLASLPGSKTPITDVITAIQIMISAVVNAAAQVAQVPGNLLNLLGFTLADGPRAPLVGAAGNVGRAPVEAPLFGRGAMQLPQAQLPVVALDAPLFGNVVNASNFGGVATTSSNHEMALSGLTPAPASVSAATTSFLDHVVKSVLVPASLTALAAIAVPGLGGLLIVCAAGIRVGYRQAKAGLALRLSGIARFAGPGPMGVVRSGSLITLHPRTSRADKPRATHAVRARTASETRLLESVA